MTMEDQLQMHPAADIFCDHLLIEVEDENKKLREDNNLLESARNFLAKIELRLRDGHVISTALKRSFAMDNHSDNYLSVPIDSDPQPLSEFSAGGVGMLGQNIGSFPGASHLVLGIRRNGTILLRFSLSKHIAVEGVINGLNDEDHVRFKNKSFGGEQIMLYLTAGVGLQNPNTITFTSTMVLMDITPELRITLKLLGPLPSHESMKDDLIRYRKEPRRPKPLTLSPSDELRLSIVAALGYDDSQIDLLCENHLLKNECYALVRIHAAIGTVEISHPSMKTRLSLKEGKLEYLEGSPVWRILFRVPVRPRIITRYNISSLAVSLSEIRLTKVMFQVANTETGDLSHFVGTFNNGAKISWACHGDSESNQLTEILVGSIQFPLSSVQNALEVLGVETN